MYNISYLIAGFIFLALMFFHFTIDNRNPNSTQSRILRYFFTIGLLDVILDLLSTCMIDGRLHLQPPVIEVTLIAFYLLQAVIPVSVYLYVVSLRDDSSLGELIRGHSLHAIPCVLIFVLILINHWTGLLFSVSPAGAYIHGPLYLAAYSQAFLYALFIVIDLWYYRKQFDSTTAMVILEYLLIMIGCVLVQAWFNHLLVTGFGLALGISVFFYKITNPGKVQDHLTGSFDHQYFHAWTGRLKKHGKAFHLLSVEMPHLQEHNSFFGSNISDQLLITVVDELRRLCPMDYIFRVKGSRLILVTENLSSYANARNGMEMFFRKPLMIRGEQYRFPALLCGIVRADKLESSELLLHYVDYLVSIIPESSETSLIQSDEETLKNFLYECEIERFLPVAIEEDLFDLHYQPIFSLSENAFVTMEALSRLEHPSLGMVSPELFISIAERRGWITEIGTLQFRRLCRFVKEHPMLSARLHSAKFNLSPAELLRPGYCRQLIATIEEFELPYDFFQFEVTETVATEYSDILYQEIAALSAKGIALNLDDFGSGYANLNTILRLPLSCVKLDRSLLLNIHDSENAAKFYRNIVAILQNLGYQVISEGLETQADLQCIASWGVDQVQGYYFSKPLAGDRLLEFLKDSLPKDSLLK